MRLSPRSRDLLLLSVLGVAVVCRRSLMDGEEPSQEVVDLGIVNCPTDGPVLLRRDLTTGVIKPLAACVYRARVVAGSTHEYRFRIAENED